MLVVRDNILYTLQRDIDDVVDLFEAFVYASFAVHLLHVEAEVIDGPLGPMDVVIGASSLSNGGVS